MLIIDTPPNEMPRIDQIWAVLSVDETGEGVVAAPIQQGMLTVPLIAADEARLEDIKKLARQLVKLTGKKMRLVKFSTRTVVEEIE
jgi:hypothetical protein